jgi:transposase
VKPHYTHIRRVKTHSGATAIQVGHYEGNRFRLHKHIGSAKELEKITELEQLATAYIRSHTPQMEINFNPQSTEILYKRGVQVQDSKLSTAYSCLSEVYDELGFNQLNTEILKHLVMIRVLEPASKLKSIYLLRKYFGVEYKRTTVFRELELAADLKEKAIQIAIDYARRNLGFDFSLVFYDVTTLYFETNRADDLRLNGFSKDNKINQPQILVGLMVNHTGFPVYYDLFPGNTFEGHTIIPLIVSIKNKYDINRLTIIADAGMLSEDNLKALEENGVDYVVGARIKRLKLEQIQPVVEKLAKSDGKLVRDGNLIWEYSISRAKKDKSDNDRQIKKAEYLITHPAKTLKRSSFITSPRKHHLILNQQTIARYRLLEGVKAYRTNIAYIADQLLVNRYKDLWHVEQSFRIAKSDLQARPIYHRKETAIRCHLLLVFMALCLTKVIEQKKRVSIQKVVDELKDIWTVTLKDQISGNSMELIINTKPH